MTETSDAGPRRRIPVRTMVAVLVLAVLGAALWLFLATREESSAAKFTGYVVSDNIYMSSPVAGTLTSIAVKRGQRVAKGDPLFQVDPTVRAAEAAQAGARISASQAQLVQQQSALLRAREELAAAEADAERYGAEANRRSAAAREKAGSVAQLEIDQSQAAYQGALRRRDAARTQVDAASSAIAAARAQLQQSQAGLTSAERQLSELSPQSPAAGRIEEIMFKPGESVSANVPIVSIVPDGEVKVRFYVPQGIVNAYQPGRRVAIGCDSCAKNMSATVDYIASRPEFTPPIIYSVDAREKLVFLVEAMPADPGALVPGQPMDVAARAEDLPSR